MKLRIGSRGSQLALWQAHHVGQILVSFGHEYEVAVIKTTGDRLQTVSLSQVGTKGMFTKEIEEALAAREIDLAVHSMKDVPTELVPEFELAATLQREDHRDAFLSVRYAAIAELPERAVVGTSSLRREAQIRTLRPDVNVSPLRGNVDTRIRKLESGEYDAILLAAAGVKRLGLQKWLKQLLPEAQFLPAVGQGALAIEVLAEPSDVRTAVRKLNHEPTERAVQCERSLLRALGGGCQVPIAALAEVLGDSSLRLDALVATPDGTNALRHTLVGNDPEALGQAVGDGLLAKGAGAILRQVSIQAAPVPLQP